MGKRERKTKLNGLVEQVVFSTLLLPEKPTRVLFFQKKKKEERERERREQTKTLRSEVVRGCRGQAERERERQRDRV